MKRSRLIAVAAVLITLLLPIGGQHGSAADTAVIEVCPGCDFEVLADAVAAAEPGDVIAISGGVHPGGLLIDKPLILQGSDGATIDGGGKGSLIAVTATDVTIDGLTLRATGSSHDKEDSAIVVDAERATITNNLIEDALFGVYLRTAHGSVVQGNTIKAKVADQAIRGDGIRIWYSNNVLVENNQATDGRDIILWYSNDGVIRNNDFDRNRYGLHLMYSDRATIESNSLDGNSIGLYIMYSRDPLVRGNSLSNNHGPTGGGLGLKDVDRAVVEGNRFVNNQYGVQIDTSPREPGIENYFRQNVFAFNVIGIGMKPAVKHNTFSQNSFIDNSEHVAIVGRGQLKEISWSENGQGNYWSDYAGYDANGDGVGDVQYRSQNLFETLTDEYPELRLFLFSPAAMAVEFAAKAFPTVRPEIKLEDTAPLMEPVVSTLLPPVEKIDISQRYALGVAASVTSAIAVLLLMSLRQKQDWQRRRTRHMVDAVAA